MVFVMTGINLTVHSPVCVLCENLV